MNLKVKLLHKPHTSFFLSLFNTMNFEVTICWIIECSVFLSPNKMNFWVKLINTVSSHWTPKDSCSLFSFFWLDKMNLQVKTINTHEAVPLHLPDDEQKNAHKFNYTTNTQRIYAEHMGSHTQVICRCGWEGDKKKRTLRHSGKEDKCFFNEMRGVNMPAALSPVLFVL